MQTITAKQQKQPAPTRPNRARRRQHAQFMAPIRQKYRVVPTVICDKCRLPYLGKVQRCQCKVK